MITCASAHACSVLDDPFVVASGSKMICGPPNDFQSQTKYGREAIGYFQIPSQQMPAEATDAVEHTRFEQLTRKPASQDCSDGGVEPLPDQFQPTLLSPHHTYQLLGAHKAQPPLEILASEDPDSCCAWSSLQNNVMKHTACHIEDLVLVPRQESSHPIAALQTRTAASSISLWVKDRIWSSV
jgi:hypothetical protein